MNGWWLDLSGNLVGTFVGALLALLSAWWLRLRQQRRDDRRLLQNLIDGLHRKRAFRPVDVSGGELLDWDDEDVQGCIDSVLDARRRIEEAADRLSTSTDVGNALDDMHRECSSWLSRTRRRPGCYVVGLMELRARLLALEGNIVEAVPGLMLREPGLGEGRTER